MDLNYVSDTGGVSETRWTDINTLAILFKWLKAYVATLHIHMKVVFFFLFFELLITSATFTYHEACSNLRLFWPKFRGN